jgi:hypothetical protein
MSEKITADWSRAYLELEEEISDLVRAVRIGRLTIKDNTDELLWFAFDQVQSRAEALKKKYHEPFGAAAPA